MAHNPNIARGTGFYPCFDGQVAGYVERICVSQVYIRLPVERSRTVNLTRRRACPIVRPVVFIGGRFIGTEAATVG